MILERRPVTAGICFGCLAYKPHLGLLLPTALAAGGYWRTFAAAAATVVVLVLASFALFGTETWAGFLGQMAVSRHLLEIPHQPNRWPTVFGAVRILGGTLALAYAAQVISSALALVAVALVWRRPGPIETKSAVLVVATFLATPYAWDYDTAILIFAAAWLAREGMRTGFLPWERIAIVALLILPLLTIAVVELTGIPLGPVVLWLVLIVLVRRILDYRLPAGDERVPGNRRIGAYATNSQASTWPGVLGLRCRVCRAPTRVSIVAVFSLSATSLSPFSTFPMRRREQ
jgi:hypothetical protein